MASDRKKELLKERRKKFLEASKDMPAKCIECEVIKTLADFYHKGSNREGQLSRAGWEDEHGMKEAVGLTAQTARANYRTLKGEHNKVESAFFYLRDKTGQKSLEVFKANSQPKTYQGRDPKGRFGGGSRSGGDKQGSKPPEKTSPDVKAPSKQPSKAPGQAPKAKQSPEKPKMSMVHGKRDKIHSVLEKHRLNPDKNKPNNIQVAHQHLENLQKTQDLKGLYKFQEHIGTMKPEEIRQFQKESGMRGKTAETLIKEANIAAQERSIWQQKCRKEGISVAHFKQAEDEIRQTHNADVEVHNRMLDSVRYSSLKPKIQALHAAGKDHTSIKRFDELATEAARSNPGYFEGVKFTGPGKNGYDINVNDIKGAGHEQQLWEYVLAGKMQPMPKSETFKLAYDRIKTMQATGQYEKRKPRTSSKDGGWGDEVPF